MIISNKHKTWMRLITIAVITTLLCQNIVWAGGTDVVKKSRDDYSCLAHFSEAGNLVPTYSKRKAIKKAGERIGRIDKVLGEVETRLKREDDAEAAINEDETEPCLDEMLSGFFSKERVGQIVQIKKGESEEVPLERYLEDMKFNRGQTRDVSQCMDEIMANAIDAVLTKYYGIETKTTGRFGLGALQMFGELLSGGEMIVLESRRQDAQEVNTFIFYMNENQEIVVKNKTIHADEYPGGFQEGSIFTILKYLNKKERELRMARIRRSYFINTSTRIYTNQEIVTSDSPWEQLNNVAGYNYLNCEAFREINKDIDPIWIRLNKCGYQVRDTGIGMSEENIVKNVLSPHIGTKGIKKQSKEERNSETGLFSKGISAKGTIYVRLNGRLIGEPFAVNSACISSEIHFIFPHSSKVLPDWEKLQIDDVAIAAFKNLCDKLTNPDDEIVDRYARLHSLVSFVNKCQTEEDRENVDKKDNLIEYIKEKTKGLIRKTKPKYIIPNIVGWEEVKVPQGTDPKEAAFLSPYIYEFSDKDFEWMERVNEDELKDWDIQKDVRIFLVDFADDGERVFLNGKNRDGEYLVIDRRIWEQYKDGDMLKEMVRKMYPYVPSGDISDKEQVYPKTKKAKRRISMRGIGKILGVAVIVCAIIVSSILGLRGIKDIDFSSKKDIDFPMAIGKESSIVHYIEWLEGLTWKSGETRVYISNTGSASGPEDGTLVNGFYGLAPNGEAILDPDAAFKASDGSNNVDIQEITIKINVSEGDIVRLLIGEGGIIDPNSIIIVDEDGVSYKIFPSQLKYEKYLEIPDGFRGNITIKYSGGIFDGLRIENLDDFKLSEQERQDAEEFFGPMLAGELGVGNLEEARRQPPGAKDRAIQKVMYDLEEYDSSKGYGWNGRSWSREIREKTENGTKKMGVICNGTAVTYYIMAKILGMDAVMVGAELTNGREVLSQSRGHVIVYVNINGIWEPRETTRFVEIIKADESGGNLTDRLKIRHGFGFFPFKWISKLGWVIGILLCMAVFIIISFGIKMIKRVYLRYKTQKKIIKGEIIKGRIIAGNDSSICLGYTAYVNGEYLGLTFGSEVPCVLYNEGDQFIIGRENVVPDWITSRKAKTMGYDLSIKGRKEFPYADEYSEYVQAIDACYVVNRFNYGYVNIKRIDPDITTIVSGRIFLNCSGETYFLKEDGGLYHNDVKQQVDLPHCIGIEFFTDDLFCAVTIYKKIWFERIAENQWQERTEWPDYGLLSEKDKERGVKAITCEENIVVKDMLEYRYLVCEDGGIFSRLDIKQKGIWDTKHAWFEREGSFFRVIDNNIFVWSKGKLTIYFADGTVYDEYGIRPIGDNPAPHIIKYEDDIYVIARYLHYGELMCKVTEAKLKSSEERANVLQPVNLGLRPDEKWDKIENKVVGENEFFISGIAVNEKGKKRRVLLRNFKEYSFEDEHVDIGRNIWWKKRFSKLISMLLEHRPDWYSRLLKRQIKNYADWSPVYLFTAYIVDRHDIPREIIRLLETFFLERAQRKEFHIDYNTLENYMRLFTLIIKHGKRFNVEELSGIIINIAQGRTGAFFEDRSKFLDFLVEKLLTKIKIDGRTIYAVSGIKDEETYNKLPDEYKMYVGILLGKKEWLLREEPDDSVFAGEPKSVLDYDPKRNMAETVYAGKNVPDEIADLDDLAAKLSALPGLKELFGDNIPQLENLPEELHRLAESGTGKAEIALQYLKIIYSMCGSVKAQDIANLFFLRELIQNGRDEMRRVKNTDGRIELRSYLNNNRWIFSVRDPCGMNIDHIVKELFPPGVTTKGLGNRIVDILEKEEGIDKSAEQIMGQIFIKDYLEDTARKAIEEELRQILRMTVSCKSKARLIIKKYEEYLLKIFAGAFGWGFYTIFADCSEVCIRTVLDGKGYEVRLRPRYGKQDGERVKHIIGITLLEAKEYEVSGEEHGTVVQRIKYLDGYKDDNDTEINTYNLFSCALEHGRARILAKLYIGAVSDVNIAWVDKGILDASGEFPIKDERETLGHVTWDKGKRHIKLMSSKLGIERVTVDELFIQEIEEKLLAGIPYPWLSRLVHKLNLNLEFDANTDVTITRTGLINPEQYQTKVRDLIYSWIIDNYRRGEIHIPGLLPYKQFIKNPFRSYPLELKPLLDFEVEEYPSLLEEREKACFAGVPEWIRERKERSDINQACARYIPSSLIEKAGEDDAFRNQAIRAVVIGVMRGEIILTENDIGTTPRETEKDYNKELEAIVNEDFDKVDMDSYNRYDKFMVLLSAAQTRIDNNNMQAELDRRYGININAGEYDCLMAFRDIAVELYAIIMKNMDIDMPLNMTYDLGQQVHILDLLMSFISEEGTMDRFAIDMADQLDKAGGLSKAQALNNILRTDDLWEKLRSRIIKRYGKDKIIAAITELRKFAETRDRDILSVRWSISLQREDCYSDILFDVDSPLEEISSRLSPYIRDNRHRARRVGEWYRDRITENSFRTTREEHREKLERIAEIHLKGRSSNNVPTHSAGELDSSV